MSGIANPGTLTRSGNATIDFGSEPNMEATVAVIGQTGILSTSQIRCSLQGDTMGSNTESDFLLAGESISFVPGIPTPGVGFTIYAFSNFAFWTSRFRVRWRWS